MTGLMPEQRVFPQIRNEMKMQTSQIHYLQAATRRQFFADAGLGIGSVALASQRRTRTFDSLRSGVG